MADTYTPKNRKTKTEFKVNKKAAKHLQKSQPMGEGTSVRYNAVKKDLSDYRMSRREDNKATKSIKRGGSSANRSKAVTMDNRAEVAKGSKASGVSVNNKMVRQGKVKSAEKMVRKAKNNMAGKRMGVAGIAAQSAATGFEVGKAVRKAVDNANMRKTAKQGSNRFKVRQMQKDK
mgnify:FL=1|tara:strand:+ start:278 stop:802 length:525 start_codon:yes stop_codon:yes gene_type:complete